jgi:hyaluronoglucosaminidase
MMKSLPTVLGATWLAVAILWLASPPASAQSCPGDCDFDNRVEVTELVTATRIALGTGSAQACVNLDTDGDGAAGIDEVVAAVGRALGAPPCDSLTMRGVIEGFYGPVYTAEQRLALFESLPAAGLDTYIYAPKLDPLHRSEWRDPYPAQAMAHFADLAARGHDIGVRFVFALSPALDFDPDAGDTERVQQKLFALYDVGVRDFCLLFDDILKGTPGAEPEVQTDLVISTEAALRGRDPHTSLCFISSLYAGNTAQLQTDSSPLQVLFDIPSSAYYRAYERIPADVPILWTGPAVFTDRLTGAEARAFRRYVHRPIILWDNYPVNDTILGNELFLGPYEGRDAEAAEALDGVVLNLMQQPAANRIPLWTAGRFFAAPRDYDPDAAWEEAMTAVGGTSGAAALRAVAEQFVSHPLIGERQESPELAADIAAYLDTGSAADAARLRERFRAYSTADGDLSATLGDPELLAELQEPARKLALSSRAGVLAVDLLEGSSADPAGDLSALQDMLAEANQIPSLVGANTAINDAVALLLGEHPAVRADVFGDFFRTALAQINGERRTEKQPL